MQDPEIQLDTFLAKYTPEMEACTRSARAWMQKRLPGALELVYDNYNALVIGYSPTERPSDAIFSLVPFPKWLTLYFLQGAGLSDPDGILQGAGNVGRHIRLKSADDLESPTIQAMIEQALRKAVVPLDATQHSRLIIRSISAKQRPRRPSDYSKLS